MLIKMTVPKLFRTQWTPSAGTWQPWKLGEHTPYEQHKQSASFPQVQCSQVQCLNGKQMPPLASAKTGLTGKRAFSLHAIPTR